MNTQTGNIVLIGLMGAGKSALGKELAKQMKKQFVDTDAEIEKSLGVTISWIFDYEGEQGFRQHEFKALAKVLRCDNQVIATGGGIVTRQKNRQYLIQQPCTIIYLKPPLEVLYKRLSLSCNRPLLNQSENRQETIRRLYNDRDPLYSEIADITLQNTDRFLDRQAKNLVQQLCDA